MYMRWGRAETPHDWMLTIDKLNKVITHMPILYSKSRHILTGWARTQLFIVCDVAILAKSSGRTQDINNN